MVWFATGRRALGLAIACSVAASACVGLAWAAPACGGHQGHDDRRIQRISLGQRAASPHLPRRFQTDRHGQSDGLRRLAARRLWRNRHGPPAGAHAVQGNADPHAHSQSAARARSPLQRHHLGRPHQLLRDDAGHRRQSGIRAWPWKPTGMINSNVSREDLISEMTVVRNEFERGENMPGVLLYQRLLATAYDWHNYGKVDDRQPHRHRARADRPAEAVLRQVLSARQRHAGRGRQVRRSQDAGADRQVFRRDPQADPQARPHLHRRAAAGRRADGDAPPRRRFGAGGGGLPHSGRLPSRHGAAWIF